MSKLEANPTAPTVQTEGLQDWLLRDFTICQKEYIVASIYPVLQKTLVHFVAEAKRSNQIQEKVEAPKQPEPPKLSAAPSKNLSESPAPKAKGSQSKPKPKRQTPSTTTNPKSFFSQPILSSN